MTQPDIIPIILKDSNCHLSLFSAEEIDALRKQVVIKEHRGKETHFVKCIVRDKDIWPKPEEIAKILVLKVC